MPPRPIRRLVAIDPGDVHCGVAMFEGESCYSVMELRPDELCDCVWLWYNTDAIDVLVVEEFRLYPEMAEQQGYSEFLTCQLIGAIKEIHRKCTTSRMPDDPLNVELVMQPASIKKPTFAQLRARKIVSTAKKNKIPGQHVLDAEAHGWHYILKTNQQKKGTK